MKANTWWQEIHTRMLASDPIAPAELADEAMPLLEKHLQIAFRSRDEGLTCDAAIDAVISYIKNPAQYDGNSRSLLGYLKMAAEGDYKNALRKQSRLRSHEQSKDPVELRVFPGNKDQEAEIVAGMDLGTALARLDSLFSDETDRRIARLVLEEERSTDVFAEVLGISTASDAAKRQTVKRHKDRIKKVLLRRGIVSHE